MDKPKVSIVLTTYNGSRYLLQAIDSCLQQTYSNLELIVVVDGSTDSTQDILKTYADPRLQILTHTVNRKLPAALNTGFAATHGEYLTWISDDNFLAPDAIRRFVEFLDLQTDIEFVYTDYILIDANGLEIGWFRVKPLSDIKKTNVSSLCFMHRRKVYDVLGNYNEKFFLAEDYEYWLRVFKNFKMYHLKSDYPMYYFRLHDQSLTSKHKWEAHALAVQLRRDILGMNRIQFTQQMAFVNVQAAFEAYKMGNFMEVCRRFWKVIVRNPLWLFNRGFVSITIRSLWKCLRHQKNSKIG